MRVERNVSARSEVTDQNTTHQPAEPARLRALRRNLPLVVYIAAIAVATLGWLSLIAWIALKLI
jgi:hypothetical protein